MSEPPKARRGGNKDPRPDLAPDEQVTGDGERSDRAPEMPAAPRKAPIPVRHLTDDEISYFIAHDPGIFADEDLHRLMEFDRAIDREMEIE